MSEYPRLDDRCIADPIIRSFLHREVIAQSQLFDGSNITYTIKLDEAYRADLVAYRVYKNSALRWVVKLVAGHESEMESLPVGDDIILPPAAWIRDRVRHYADTPEVV
ncbi:baseplate protein [Hafnia alvei]|uniref:baseplate protein n=1 Tax=Hafnia alvei TaxID=569 RepID=UPI002DBAC755|nr:baseplate protein [Hafnia alvei]MEB7891866.1 baseplate protein [Hafnia alvei]